MNALEIISRIQSMPDAFTIVTTFADGSDRRFNTKTRGQAENYLVGEHRKIGKALINRETGATVHVVSVEIVAI